MTDEQISIRASLIKQIMDLSNKTNMKLLNTLLSFSDNALRKLRDELLERMEGNYDSQKTNEKVERQKTDKGRSGQDSKTNGH